MQRLRRWGAVLAGTAVALGCVAAGSGPPGEAIDLAVPGRVNAHPATVADGSFVAVTWAASDGAGVTDIYASTSRDAARAFGAPVRVNDVPGDAKVSGEQPPRVTLVRHRGGKPSVVVVWTAKGPTGTRLLSARSDDGGGTFGRAMSVPGSDAVGNRGWESTATDRQGQVLAIWLDHREAAMSGSAPAMHHDGQEHAGHGDVDGVARAQRSKLYFARLDGSGVQSVAGGVCYCCKTALAIGADGSIYAAWRHVYAGNDRDIAFTQSRDGGRTFAPPIRVSEDKWALDGCPENGPALAVDARNTAHLVWPTLVSHSTGEPALALFYAVTRDGQRFSVRQPIPTQGVPRHPQMAVDGRGSLLVAWDEQAEGTRRVVAARVVPEEGHAAVFTRVDVGGHERSDYPTVTVVTGGFAIAWCSGLPTRSVIRIARLPSR